MVGFRVLPRSLPYILKSGILDQANRLIFSSSRKASLPLLNALAGAAPASKPAQFSSSEKSRYAIIARPDREIRYFFINSGAVAATSIESTAFFIQKSVEFLFENNGYDTSDFLEMTVETLFDYVKRSGFPYVFASQESREFSQEFPLQLPRYYAELRASRSLMDINPSEGESLILSKMRLLFAARRTERMPLEAVYSYLSSFAQACILLTAVSSYPVIQPSVADAFEQRYSLLKAKLRDHPDLLRAFEAMRKELSHPSNYETFDQFSKSIVNAFRSAFAILSSQYIRLAELEPLMTAAQLYEKQILERRATYLEGLGTVNNFLSQYEPVMDREGNPVEIRVLMGEILLRVMIVKVFVEQDAETLASAISLASRFASLLDTHLEQIQKDLGRFELKGTPLDYGSAVTTLYSFAQIALALGDTTSCQEMEAKAREMAARRNATPTLILLAWKDYLATQSGAYLSLIGRLVQRPGWEDLIDMGPYLRLLNSLVQGIEGGGEARFEEARNAALDIVTVPVTSGLQTIPSSSAYFHAVQVFESVTAAVEAEDYGVARTHIDKALMFAQLMTENLAPRDFLHHLARRIRMIHAVFNGRFEAAYEVCKEDNESILFGKESDFNRIVADWCNSVQSYPGRAFSLVGSMDYDASEPLTRLIKKEMLWKMNFDLQHHVVGAKAIVFTEGAFDDAIMEELTRTLYPKFKVTYLNAGGFSKIPFFAEAKMTGAFQMPVFLLFDGDVPSDSKTRTKYQKIRQELGLPPGCVKVLRENSIEGFLLVPSAILRAFQVESVTKRDLEEFIENRRTKQNRKTVLEATLSHCGIPKYTAEVARKLASSLKIDEIDLQLGSFIGEFCRSTETVNGEFD